MHLNSSKFVLVYALHSLEYVLGLARFRVFVPKLHYYLYIIMLKNTIAVLQKTFIRSALMTNHGSMRMTRKQYNSPPWLVFEDEPNPTKVVRVRRISKEMVACFFGKTGHVATVPLEHRRTVHSECSIMNRLFLNLFRYL